MNPQGAYPGSSSSSKGDTAPGSHLQLSTGPPRMSPEREQQLVAAYREGDPQALAELLASYQRRIFGLCYRMVQNSDVASDLTQDVLVRIIEALDSYDGRSKLSTWIIRVAMNCCLSYLRKQKLRRHRSLDLPTGTDQPPLGSQIVAGGELSGIQNVEQAESRKILLQALLSLDLEVRSILVLRDMQDLDYQQIAEVLEVPLGTVKSRLFRARAELRNAVRNAETGNDTS